MYPDWPESQADLVPLPSCDGPKLRPFDFQGPQRIDFLEHLGEGTHAHVFKVNILGHTYALKLFRFVYDHNWLGPASDTDPDDRELMEAFYNYSEPFSCECRAFGRLQESDHEELAIQCFGYVLLDEKHELAIMTQFSDLELDFNGDIDYPGVDDMRSRFLGRDGKAPPIRGIVKKLGYGYEEKNLRPPVIRKILRDIIKLQKLGIIRLDITARQIIDDRLSDFSTALTIPHFLTTPNLNPGLTPEMISAMELETFKLSISDYLAFDEMIYDLNLEYAAQNGRISVHAFPGGDGCRMRYNFRSKVTKERVYTFVDPRQYDWGRGTGMADARQSRRSGPTSKISRRRSLSAVHSKTCRRLSASPSLWYYHTFDGELAVRLRKPDPFMASLKWDYKQGFIFPRV
ncbi:kinetochore Sim4 complex subunit FTA2-domain-containing protein [Xylariaceae sp. FL0662B]|nr:kinetochore Sim4 complex subunit FTA2-domain-containing protein [Xylariaceae sp. FL0662B]